MNKHSYFVEVLCTYVHMKQKASPTSCAYYSATSPPYSTAPFFSDLDDESHLIVRSQGMLEMRVSYKSCLWTLHGLLRHGNSFRMMQAIIVMGKESNGSQCHHHSSWLMIWHCCSLCEGTSMQCCQASSAWGLAANRWFYYLQNFFSLATSSFPQVR